MTTYFRVGDLIQWKHPTIASAFGHTKERAWFGIISAIGEENGQDYIGVQWFQGKNDVSFYAIRWSENNFVRL